MSNKYAALEAAAMAATPGPWLHRHDPGNPAGVQHGVKLAGEFGAWVCDCLDNADNTVRPTMAGERNAAYIAAANPAAISALLADLRALQQRNQELTRETAAATAARRIGPRPPSKAWTEEMRAEHRERKRRDAELAKMYEARAEGVKR